MRELTGDCAILSDVEPGDLANLHSGFVSTLGNLQRETSRDLEPVYYLDGGQ